jgi:hypothetical protein
MKTDEHILADIDATLDQLIYNAEAMSDLSILSEIEMEAMQKTQESLLARIFHMDDLINAEKKERLLKKKSELQLEEKIAHFSRLNTQLINGVANRFKAKSKKSLRLKQR